MIGTVIVEVRLIPLISPQGFGEFGSLFGIQIGLHHESLSVIGGNRFKEACEVQAHCLLGIQSVQGALGKKSGTQNTGGIETQSKELTVGILRGEALPDAPHCPDLIGMQSGIENERCSAGLGGIGVIREGKRGSLGLGL